MSKLHLFIILGLLILCSGCGKSDEEVDILIEDSYNQGYWDALDCVKRKGGYAENAARDCENE